MLRSTEECAIYASLRQLLSPFAALAQDINAARHLANATAAFGNSRTRKETSHF